MDKKQVSDYMKSGLMGFKKLAKAQLRQRWTQMSVSEKTEAARALVYMEEVAKHPQDFFAPEYTLFDWNQRAKEYALSHDLPDTFYAFYIVPSPVGLVNEKTQAALVAPLWAEYYNFMNAIQDYAYNEKKGSVHVYEEKVVSLAKQIQKRLKIMRVR